MQHSLINLKVFPKQMKKVLHIAADKNFNLVGSTSISQHYNTPIIQCENKERLWLLEYEIASKTSYKLYK